MATVTPDCTVGRTAPDFELLGVDGRLYTYDEVRGPNGTLVMFLCNHCPYVKAVARKIVRDTAALREHGIGAVAIMPNDTDAYPDDDYPQMQVFARQHGFGFPYLIDRTQDVARAYDAVCTPDFFGFDKDRGLQYRGRLDDARTDVRDGTARELYEAMVSVAEGKGAPSTQNPSMGCSIKWRAA